ncbi:hypothetical protein [uncultured Tateyamaria sp.]|uniref:hypothetical protein n=1 Tax=uncultured Tateyamaria sp. TaxID=455651 RepID=UPI00261E1092|nr:hypothetical protein [uncultured Tateyamaria sp.]
MRLFSLVSAIALVAGPAAADCAGFLSRLQKPDRVARICSAEATMPFDIRGRWIDKRFVAFASAERFEGDDKVQKVGLLDGDGRPFTTVAAATRAAQWFDKSTRCSVNSVIYVAGGVTTARMVCPADN